MRECQSECWSFGTVDSNGERGPEGRLQIVSGVGERQWFHWDVSPDPWSRMQLVNEA